MPDQTPAPLRAERDFFSFLEALFDTYDRGERGRVAERIGFDYPLLYRRMRGDVMWKPEEIRRFIAACPDAQVAQWFLEESRFLAVERPAASAATGEMAKAVTDAVHQTIDIWEELVRCGDFDRLAQGERETLLHEVREAERAIAGIRQRLLHPSFAPGESPIRNGFSSA